MAVVLVKAVIFNTYFIQAILPVMQRHKQHQRLLAINRLRSVYLMLNFSLM
jgi:hypothetical protein